MVFIIARHPDKGLPADPLDYVVGAFSGGGCILGGES
jgi:hypothetical protein